MKFGKSYGLECGHHTPRESTEIQFEDFKDIDEGNKAFWDSLVLHYRNFSKQIPGLDTEHCPKCNDMKRIVRIHIFTQGVFDDPSGIRV